MRRRLCWRGRIVLIEGGVPGVKLFVAAIVKDEQTALLEWLAWHRVVGVSGFLIADNGSTDGTRELLLALQAAGVLQVFDFPGELGKTPQLPAYRMLLRRCPATVDALAFIDADEFLLPLDGEASLLPFVRTRFADERVSAVALNWANFGSSGEQFAGDGLVIERFTRRAPQAFGANHNYKSIVCPARAASFHNPHYVNLHSGLYVDAAGRELVEHPHQGPGLSAEVCWQGARVNHYAVKSLEEFLLGKARRGSAATLSRIKHQAYFKAHDRNDEPCLLAANLAPAVREEMARLQALLDAAPVGWPARWRAWWRGRGAV